MKRHKSIDKVANAIGLPADVASDSPLIYIEGASSLRCENHKGIVEYTENCLRLDTKEHILKITGNSIMITEYGNMIICVQGIFAAMEFIKKN